MTFEDELDGLYLDPMTTQIILAAHTAAIRDAEERGAREELKALEAEHQPELCGCYVMNHVLPRHLAALTQPTTEPPAGKACQTCGGTGDEYSHLGDAPRRECHDCHGTGRVEV